MKYTRKLELRLDVLYLKDSSGDTTTSRLPVDVGVRYLLVEPSLRTFLPYGQGSFEACFDRAEITYGSTMESSRTTNLGASLGGGVEYRLTRAVGLDINAIYHVVNDPYLALGAGVTFRFGGTQPMDRVVSSPPVAVANTVPASAVAREVAISPAANVVAVPRAEPTALVVIPPVPVGIMPPQTPIAAAPVVPTIPIIVPNTVPVVVPVVKVDPKLLPPIYSDGDGVPDRVDRCPNTPPGTVVNASGCPEEANNRFCNRSLTIAILFNSGETGISDEYYGELNKIGEFMRDFPSFRSLSDLGGICCKSV